MPRAAILKALVGPGDTIWWATLETFTHLSLCLLTEEVREDTRPTRTRESFAPQLDTPPGAAYISIWLYNQRVIDA